MASPRVIALDLGGTKLLSGVVDEQGVVERRVVSPTDVSTEDAVLEQVEAAVQGLLTDVIGAIGIGIPSTIDQRRGEAIDSVNIPLSDVPLRDRLHERFGVPVAIENDANAAALAEHRYGAGRGSRHMLMLTLGTGIGGGLILDGSLYRGSIGAAGELGHVTIDLDGPPCQGRCPGRGHLEVLASGTAADALAREQAERNPDGDLGRASTVRPSAAARPRSPSGFRSACSRASASAAVPDASTSRCPRPGQRPWHGGPSRSIVM